MNQLKKRFRKQKKEQDNYSGKIYEKPPQQSNYFIGTIEQAPDYLKDQYIKYGYRINFRKKRAVFKSLFMWHNESINVWSHLAVAIFLIIFIGIIYSYDSGWKEKALDQINDKLYILQQEIYQLEDEINTRLDKGIQSLQLIRNDLEQNFQSKLVNFFQEIEKLQEFTKQEIEILQNMMQSQLIHKKNLMKETFQEFQIQFFKLIESKKFDWINTLTNKSEEDIKIEDAQLQISKWPIFGFLISAILCLGASAIYHLFYCLSYNSNKILLRLDYAGICFLVAGSTLPPTFYGFYCNQIYAIVYTLIISFICLIVFSISMFDFIHTLEWRPTKCKMYAALGILSSFPQIHLILGNQQQIQGFDFISLLPSYLTVGFFYLCGLYIFQVRFPEKQRPGQFDNCGQSHQIWHICVVIGVFFTYIPTINSYDQRKQLLCPN